MIIEQVTDLGKNALGHQKKYNGFLGVSIPHRFFSKKNMTSYLLWSLETFNQFCIILMDDPERYNFKIFKNLGEKEALKRAREKSDELKRAYNKIIKGSNISNMKIVQFRDFINDRRFIKILNEIKYFFDSDEEFKRDLFNLMDLNIGRKINELLYKRLEMEEERRVLVNYIIEELAAILYFTEIGYCIEISPNAEFSTKKRIYEGDFPVLYERLKLTRRGHLFAHPEGILKST